MLSEVEIRRRLQSEDADRLTVTPLLPNSVKGAALDLHLGSKFIVFQRSVTSSFDPLSEDFDPRAMQSEIDKTWGDKFVLHPHELVLASTLEYFSLPADLSAQVVTRSSYGRLGLISATAVLVHPHFHGCLTLELLNMGQVPLELMPGERIAQLVLASVSPAAPTPDDKYFCPIGPEFSKVQRDPETGVLRRMHERFTEENK